MIDEAELQELANNLEQALKRSEARLDDAVRLMDSVTPTDDFQRLVALDEPAMQAELWLSRALGFITALRILHQPNTKAEALATAVNVALEELWVERTRLQSRIMAQRNVS